MSAIIETIVYCDNCGETLGADDRSQTAKEIRRGRKLAGWIHRGSKDYCEKCASKRKPSPEFLGDCKDPNRL